MRTNCALALVSLLLAAAPAARAQTPAPPCRPLLTVADSTAPAAAPALALDTCSVRVEAGARPLSLRVTGAGGDALAQALAAGGGAFGALLDARLRVAPASRHAEDAALAGLPAGPLLLSQSARLLREGHWRWHAGERRLAWMPRSSGWGAAEMAACAAFAARRVVFWGGALERQPGEWLAPRPWAPGHAPGFATAVPPQCVAGWRLDAGAPATLDADTGVLVLDAAAARAGSPQAFSVFAQVAGKTVEGRVLAYDPRRRPLVGDWRRVTLQDCSQRLARMVHLELKADGQFRWREQLFETRYDAWGRYAHAVQQATVRFDVEDGNDTDDLLRVQAGIEWRPDGQLVLRDVAFALRGDGAPAPSACAMTYRRPS